MTSVADHVLLPSGAQPRQPQLPTPDGERFRPLRCGMINLYRYDYQEFVFEQGRLLLRGNNGTGKSRVLALTLPFLLDGEVGSHRLEPDGDSARKIEWNLLLGGKHDDRTGYCFVEFGRKSAEGEAFVTLGCGLHAVSGGGLVGKWFFVTRQRIGRDLFLVARGGYPIGRERLTESIGAHGQVFTSASQYRQRVDQELFQLGIQRYEALLGLLIQLRKPQLSRQLNEKALSRALSEALAPLPESVLATVAEAFHGLERDRTELSNYQGAEAAVREFLSHYERYAQTVTRRRAARVRSAHAAYEDAQRNLREAEKQREAAAARLRELEEEQGELERKEQIHDEEIRVLSGRPELADGQRIESERRRVEELKETCVRAHSDVGRAQQIVENLTREHKGAEEASKRAGAKAEREAHSAWERAEQAGTLPLHREAMSALTPLANAEQEVALKAERALQDAITKKQRGVAEVRKLNEQLSKAQRAFDRAREVLQERQDELDRRLAEEADARDALFEQRDMLARAYRSFCTEARELRPADPEEVVAELASWVESGEGTTPVARALRTAGDEAIARLSAATQRAELAVREAQRICADLKAERQRTADARHLPPPSPYTRRAESRADRPGAPLWAVCDFRPDVPEPVRAQIEAALEASGLLDAWICPDGRLLEPGTHDTALVMVPSGATFQAAPVTQHLGQILLPAIDRQSPQATALTDGTVAALLREIRLGEPSAGEEALVWVSESGRFRVGPLVGEWNKPAAQHIGEGAREESRRQRLRELDEQIARAEQLLNERKAEKKHTEERQEQAQREIRDAPGDQALLKASQALSRASQESRTADHRFGAAEANTRQCQTAYSAKQAERDAVASELGLSEWLERLEVLKDLLADYSQALTRVIESAKSFFLQRMHMAKFAGLLSEAQQEEDRRRVLAREAEAQLAAAQNAYELLERTVGVEFRRVQEQLADAREQRRQVRERKKAVGEERGSVLKTSGRAQVEAERHGQAMTVHAEERGQAILQVQTLAKEQLLALAAPQVVAVAPSMPDDEWSTTRAVELCRALEQQLENVESDDSTWQRRRNELYTQAKKVEEALSKHGQKTNLYEVDEVFVVTGQIAERLVPMAELKAFLDEQVQFRQSLLSQREREVLENHLLSEVAHELHDRIQQAEALLAEMNRELLARPTTMGIKLRFVWSLDENAPPGLPEVRKLLLRAVGVWSPAERRAVADFLQQQIKRAREENLVGTWLEHLGAAFDYRAWHQFIIELHQDGTWQKLTRKIFGTGSGGEKAVALTLPQFAAAAAHYRSAALHAPRLILLDEVFVGIDREMRSKCMALLRDFDLDFVMTSENEWACYATLPGVAICHMTARAGIDAVAVSRWVWTGRERRRAEVAPPPLREPDEPPEPKEAGATGVA